MASTNSTHSRVPPEDERRRHQRLCLQFPLFIRVREPQGRQFVELGKTLNISACGSLLTCPRSLAVGEMVTLTIPAPSITSSALVPAGMSPILAKVTRQQEAGDVYLVSVEFMKPIS